MKGKSGILSAILTFIVVLAALLLVIIVSLSAALQQVEVVTSELDGTKALLSSTQIELTATRNKLTDNQESLSVEVGKVSELQSELDTTKQELDEAMAKIESLSHRDRTYNGWPMCWRTVSLEQWEIDFFAKLLYCEAGGMGYDGQFWVASAILNLSEISNMSIWEMGHKVSMFEVAPYVDNATPTQKQYDIINEVLSHGWIADVAYFRTDYPHDFGKFMIQIENVCFNSP